MWSALPPVARGSAGTRVLICGPSRSIPNQLLGSWRWSSLWLGHHHRARSIAYPPECGLQLSVPTNTQTDSSYLCNGQTRQEWITYSYWTWVPGLRIHLNASEGRCTFPVPSSIVRMSQPFHRDRWRSLNSRPYKPSLVLESSLSLSIDNRYLFYKHFFHNPPCRSSLRLSPERPSPSKSSPPTPSTMSRPKSRTRKVSLPTSNASSSLASSSKMAAP